MRVGARARKKEKRRHPKKNEWRKRANKRERRRMKRCNTEGGVLMKLKPTEKESGKR